MADLARLVLEVDSKGVVSGKMALDQLGESANKTQTGTRGIMSTFRDMQAVMQGPIAAIQMAKAAFMQTYAAMDQLITVGAAAQASLVNFESVLAATGGVAGVTRKELNWLVEEMAGSTLFDDEDVRDAITALTRFRTVSGDTFREAIKLSADLAQVGGGSMAQYAQALGKAFKGEEEGLTMLKRANIVLSNEQQEMAKAMYAAGDAAGAQKLILAELTNQLGGAATAATNTATGAFSEMKEAINEVKESLGMLVAQIAQESGLTGWVKNTANALNAMATTKEAFVRWSKGGSLSASDVDIALKSTGEYLRILKTNLETTWDKSAALKMRPEIQKYENFRAALLSLQLQYDALEKSAAKSNDTTSETPIPDSGVRGYSTSYQYEGAGLEQIDIINAVIQKEQEEKALREASAESVAEYWAEYIKGCELAADAAEWLAEAEKKAKQAELDKIIEDLNKGMEDLMKTAGSDAFIGIMEAMGAGFAGGADAGQDMADVLISLGETILTMLPRLLLTAGVNCIIAGQYGVGIALIAASGLVAIGGGAVSEFASRATDSASSASATAATTAAAASAPSARMSSVTIINNSGVPLTATTTESDSPGGRQMTIEVTKAVRAAVSSGALDSSMRSRFGLAANGVRKG